MWLGRILPIALFLGVFRTNDCGLARHRYPSGGTMRTHNERILEMASNMEREELTERHPKNLRSSGPCLMCDRQTEYLAHGRYGFYSRYGNKWLDRHFASTTRAEHIEAFRKGHIFDRTTRYALFEGFVCAVCKGEVERGWPEKQKEPDASEE
jgi:hypothetical protein